MGITYFFELPHTLLFAYLCRSTFYVMRDNSTIVAIATPAGLGAIAVIRLSGSQSFTIVDKLFVSPSGKKINDQKANTIHFGKLQNHDGVIDEVLVSIFKSPHSFTGEDVAEISCHGSPYIQQRIVEALIANGATLAQPGEFTQRAFLNGKFDLSQAEAVADLIASTNKASHRLAMNQMRGGFSKEIEHLREQLLTFTSLIELELDFSEEDVEFADRTNLRNLITSIMEHIGKLAKTFSLGNAVKSGIPVAIVGNPNVGKSTLLNALLNEDKAIVSDIAGTTRDVIEDVFTINGIDFRFIDTAGIRHTHDTIESLGIERTYQKVAQATIILLLIDPTSEFESCQRSASDICSRISEDQHLIVVFNKIDSVEGRVVDSYKHKLVELFAGKIEVTGISAKHGKNLEELSSMLVQKAGLEEMSESNVIVTNMRHFEALNSTLSALQRALDGLNMGISGDFLSQDIREAIFHLGQITGTISTDDILGAIFSKFCIGK